MKNRMAAIAAALTLAGCSQGNERQAAPANDIAVNHSAQEPLSPPAPGTPGGLPADARSPSGEPKGPIDPRSSEAAGQVVQQFGALIEQKRFAEARELWADPASADRLRALLSGYSEAHLEIGGPGGVEGAAGSSYVTIPVVLYGRRKSGPQASTRADVVLRRVNDVPGSTEAQRRWRIERIELKSPD